MKKIKQIKKIVGCIAGGLALVLAAASCGLFFAEPSGADGGEGTLAVTIAGSGGERFLGPPAALPVFSGGRISLRADSDKVVERSFRLNGGVSGVRIPVPVGTYTGMTLWLTVDHANPAADTFPFAKTFEGGVTFENPIPVSAGSTAETPPVEISLSETAVIVHRYDDSVVDSDGFTFIPVWDFSKPFAITSATIQIPALASNRFAIDPAGRFYTAQIDESGESWIARYGGDVLPEPFVKTRNISNDPFHCSLAYDSAGGRLYFTNMPAGELAYIDGFDTSPALIGVSKPDLWASPAALDGNGNLFMALPMSETIADIYIKGFVHNTVTDTLESHNLPLFPLNPADVYKHINGLAPGASIDDLDQINVEDFTVSGEYLYMLLTYYFSNAESARNESVVAAIPLRSPGTSADEVLADSRYLYSGDAGSKLHLPRRVSGWGPGVLYITDEELTPSGSICRILKLEWNSNGEFAVADELEYQRR